MCESPGKSMYEQKWKVRVNHMFWRKARYQHVNNNWKWKRYVQHVERKIITNNSYLPLIHTLMPPLVHSSFSAIAISTCKPTQKTTHAASACHVLGLSSFTSPFLLKKNWFCHFSLSPFTFLFLALLLLPVIHALPPVSLHTISLNANGLADPMKTTAIWGMEHFSQPHAFVIGETKNSEPISSWLGLKEYELHENPGQPLHPRNKGKWGVIVGIQCGMFNVQLVSTQETLQGRAVSLDLTIPTDNKLDFHHCLIGVYALWYPGGQNDDEHLFWPEITHLANSATFSWSLHGDLNATLLASESSSTSLNISSSHIAYSHFLNSTDRIDLWRTQAECDVYQHYTHHTQQNTTNLTHVTCSIIVRGLSTVIQKVEILDDLRRKCREPKAKLNSKVGIFYPHFTLIYYGACDRLSNNS